jgi:glyoxylase I family protein
MKLHHIAIGAHDVAAVAAFYRDAFDFLVETEHRDPNGELRSIWLQTDEGIRLMIERTEQEPRRVPGVGAGPFLLAFAVPAAERSALEHHLAQLGSHVEARTAYTSYMRDPEGNRVAISAYPERI